MENLRDELNVTPNPGTSYIIISFAARNREDATTIVNTVIERYDERVQDMTRVLKKVELQDYKEQQTKLEDQLNKLLEEKKTYMSEHINTPGGVDAGPNVVSETLRAIASAVVQLEQEMLQFKALYENLKGLGADQIVVSPEMTMMIQSDPRVASLQQSRDYLEQQKTILLQQVGASHRSVQQLQSNIDAVDEKLKETMAKKEKEVRDYQVNSAYTRYQNAMQAMLALRSGRWRRRPSSATSTRPKSISRTSMIAITCWRPS
jgi:uncharacterized protein involved in exopolysaccharide biosynthesis